MASQNITVLSQFRVWVLSVVCGFAVANLYYSQPLLPLMGHSFNVEVAAQGVMATVLQLGYALGLLLFGPLGDKANRRILIVILLIINAFSMAACAMAYHFYGLLVACLAVGLTSISAQIVIPAVAGMADASQRGRIVGQLMSGLFAGTLLARTISGYVGAIYGWRMMFFIAAIIDLFMIALVWKCLPSQQPNNTLSYPKLLSSLVGFVVHQPLLREAGMTGFLSFAAFNALWGALAVQLAQPPYQWGSDIAGLFGLVGLVGIVASSFIGRCVDRWGGRRVVGSAACVLLLAFLAIGSSAHGVWLLLFGIVVLDLGSRSNLVANQTRIYALLPQARGRLNTVFMFCYFMGGATGSALGTLMAFYYGWLGIALVGITSAVLVLLITLNGMIRRKGEA